MPTAKYVYLTLILSKWQPHPKYKANSARTSHSAVWERVFNRMTGDELHDSAERGPVDTGKASEGRN